MITRWKKSSKSGSNGGSCVEIRENNGTIQVRDSKDPSGPILTFNAKEWAAFIGGAKDGEFDL
ncbi:MAG: DUF397 domain-containing protein [Actinobacteria bacterium]|nr:MAG: DUF397 domain-containing protein [Actinomycetota bacterium]